MNVHRFDSSVRTQEVLSQIDTATKETNRNVIYSLTKNIFQKVQTFSNLKLEDKIIIAKKAEGVINHYFETHSLMSRIWNFVVTKIFRQHSDYDIVDGLKQCDFNMSLMQQALDTNNTKVLADLLKKGISPNTFIKVENRDTPAEPALLIAARKGNIETMNVLIEAGADVNLRLPLEFFPEDEIVLGFFTPERFHCMYTPESRTILRYLAKTSIKDSTYAPIERLMECEEVKNIPLSLRHLVQGDNLRTIRMLLEKGIDPNKMDKDVKESPMEYATSIEALELLHQHQAHIPNGYRLFHNWTGMYMMEGYETNKNPDFYSKAQGIRWLLDHHVNPDGKRGYYALSHLEFLMYNTKNQSDEKIDLFFKVLERTKSAGFYKMKVFSSTNDASYTTCKNYAFESLKNVKDPQKLLEYKKILLEETDWVTPEIMAADSDFQRLSVNQF